MIAPIKPISQTAPISSSITSDKVKAKIITTSPKFYKNQ
jgi:hypothetical protein